MPAPRVATFDCYGTLVDWDGGLATFLYDLCLRHGQTQPESGRVLRERWEEIQFAYVQGEYMRYREVLARSLQDWMGERGLEWDDAEGEALLRSMRSWQPFPDTRPALTRARQAGVRLVILSNTDRDIIEHTLRQLEVPFDQVLTAEDIGAYKPSQSNFDYALREIGEPADQIVHVAFGFKYDIGPAGHAGMRTAWVNRYAEPAPGEEPYDHEWRDLWGLAELAESG